MLQHHTLDDLLWDMVDQIGNLLDLEDCVIYLVEGDVLVQAAAYGPKNPTRWTITKPIAIPIGTGIVGTVARTRRPEIVADTLSDARYISDQFAGASELTVPIIFQDEVIGVLDSEAEGSNVYTQDDLTLFQSIANVAATRIAWLRSEQKRAEEEEARHAERLESLGKLAGGVAHDFNNLLTVIGLHLDLAMEAHDEAESEEARDTALQAIERAKGLTKQLMVFARGGEPLREEVALEPLVREALSFLGGHEGLELTLDMPDELPVVWGDPGQLGQVFHNLMLNAAQAMSWCGAIKVSATTRDGADGRTVCVTVEDQGPGVPQSLRNRIFDPYYSTKGNGTGLGLATSYWIVRRHGGDLDVGDAADGGACFSIRMPALHLRVVRSPETAEVALPNLRVLVLDDEVAVADGLRRHLARTGHAAISVVDGTRVAPMWERARAEGRPFDVAILDLVQPGRAGGVDALAQLRAVDPKARAVVMSSYFENPVMVDYAAHGFNARLAKPFRLNELQHALKEACAVISPCKASAEG
jgi:signal transduction histidine kinase/ActR/RegA family two-component response regulator